MGQTKRRESTSALFVKCVLKNLFFFHHYDCKSGIWNELDRLGQLLWAIAPLPWHMFEKGLKMAESGRSKDCPWQSSPLSKHGDSISCLSCMSKRCCHRDHKTFKVLYANKAEHCGLTHVPPKNPSNMFRDGSVSAMTDGMWAGLVFRSPI